MYFAVTIARQRLPRYNAEIILKMYFDLISTHILNPFLKLRTCTKWDTGMDIIPENETTDTTQYQQRSLKYVKSKYCAKH